MSKLPCDINSPDFTSDKSIGIYYFGPSKVIRYEPLINEDDKPSKKSFWGGISILLFIISIAIFMYFVFNSN